MTKKNWLIKALSLSKLKLMILKLPWSKKVYFAHCVWIINEIHLINFWNVINNWYCIHYTFQWILLAFIILFIYCHSTVTILSHNMHVLCIIKRYLNCNVHVNNYRIIIDIFHFAITYFYHICIFSLLYYISIQILFKAYNII